MVEVMKIMATSFKRLHASTATLSVPNPAAGHRQPTPQPETLEYSQTSLDLVRSLLLCPGTLYAQSSVCALPCLPYYQKGSLPISHIPQLLGPRNESKNTKPTLCNMRKYEDNAK